MTMNAMPRIDRASLMTLEAYARERPQFRAKVIAHKKNRTLHLGEHVTLIFEDELTIRYQVQEMLRVEKIFEEQGIQDEAWVRVEGCARVYAVADEDLERETEEKTSSVHFLRFELTREMVEAL